MVDSQQQHKVFSEIKKRFYELFKSNKRFFYPELAIVISLGLAWAIFGLHLFDNSVPVQGDVRSHIFKIEIYHHYLSQFRWPGWVPYWYEGIPLNQYYPPGFYFLGALFAYILGSTVVAYKVLTFLTMAACGCAVYVFSRRFLRIDANFSILALLIYQTSIPLLLNFTMGEGPNLLGWSMSIVFLAFYLSNSIEHGTKQPANKLFPGFLLGITILIHPFPVVFAVLAIVLYHIIRTIHLRFRYADIKAQFSYALITIGIGLIIGAYYWVPLLLTLKYASPIYAFTRYNWYGGTKYVLAMTAAALAVGLIARFRVKNSLHMDFLIVTLCLAAALGLGATRYFPLGLGSFLQDFRFETIIGPFFALMLIIFSLSHSLSRQVRPQKIAIAVAAGIILSFAVFALDSRGSIKGWESLITVVKTDGSLQFASTVIPYFIVLLFLAMQVRPGVKALRYIKTVPALVTGVCLVFLVSVTPFIYTGKALGLDRLFSYNTGYLQPDYAELMESVQGSRLIVPILRGYLTEGDSPVTFGWRWGVETVNGPYNQGDPKFFKHTVHLEWEERWLDYRFTRENLMQESAARYIFFRDSFGTLKEPDGMITVQSNSFGQVLALDKDICRAVSVTPILLDAKKPDIVTEFFNILLPEGYKMVLVDSREVDKNSMQKFDHVMVDDRAKIGKYPGKNIILLNESPDSRIVQEAEITRLDIPYLSMANWYFYHGDKANGYMWIGFDGMEEIHLAGKDSTILTEISSALSTYLGQLDYTPASYESNGDIIEVKGKSGFTLIKDSYFPYWKSEGDAISATSQGFMLVYSDSSMITLKYTAPLVDRLAATFTISGIIAVITILIVARRFVFRRS